MTDWRRVPEFPDYYINEFGDLMNDKRHRLLTTRMNHQDFLMVGVVQNGKQYTRSVAVLVAKAFLPKPRNSAYNSVIHLNGDRSDCRALNLMWRPRWYAIRYHQMFEEDPLRISVYVPHLNKVFNSLREFCTTYGVIEYPTYVDMTNGDGCFHYGWKLEKYEK